jgi:hypothetical protein
MGVKAPRLLPLGAIRTDGGTQIREYIDEEVASDYADAMRSGAMFPPIAVFHDGVEYWLADGFHRVTAAHQAGHDSILAVVHLGGQREARFYACGANAMHGLRRTNADKWRAVKALLCDGEWRQRSDNWIARYCMVSQPFVSSVRAEISVTSSDYKSERRLGLDGRIIHTERIGGTQQDAIGSRFEASAVMPLFSSASVEWYTPPDIVERVIGVLGTIDLDPCSNSREAPNVPAHQHFTVDDDGLAKTWRGTVFMNPPYGRMIGVWVEKFSASANRYRLVPAPS